jgi:hypothetical protein
LTRARAFCDTGQCLALLGQQMGVAWALLNDVEQRSAELGLTLPGVPLGLGIVQHHLGHDERSRQLLERARSLSAELRERWLEWECSSHLVMLALDQRDFSGALAQCEALLPLAEKLGEGSEAPVAAALAALARTMLRQPGAKAEVEACLAVLRSIDTKRHVAYLQNTIAELELEQGETRSAASRLEEALVAAEAVNRRSEAAMARALLARIALHSDDRARAEAHVLALEQDLAEPFSLSAKARGAVEDVARALGLSIPTPAVEPPIAQAT